MALCIKEYYISSIKRALYKKTKKTALKSMIDTFVTKYFVLQKDVDEDDEGIDTLIYANGDLIPVVLYLVPFDEGFDFFIPAGFMQLD